MRRLKQITWARWVIHDSYQTEFFTVFTATIPHPSYEFPIPCAMMSCTNNSGKVFIRFRSLAELKTVFVIPEEYISRIETGYRQAIVESERIQAQIKAMVEVQKLPPGTKLVRSDTGEVLQDVEMYLKDKR